jgi:YD repeat-containing protein
VRQEHDCYLSRIWLCFALFAVLTCSAASSLAQKTVKQDAGGGRKLEFDYNTAGQVTEQRTMGADGKLEQKVDYESRPGYFVADQTTTFYWPDGKVHRITKNTYDASANFTGEFVQELDESGKQTAGHRLTHDPMTNVYTCADWSTATQTYKSVECPAGEESSGGSEGVKKFTYDEIMKHLEAARKAAGQQNPQVFNPERPAVKTKQEVGLIVPAQVHPGERVSGRMVANAAEYADLPDVTVIEVAAPGSSDEASTLAGWTVEVAGESPQRTDGPITFTVPRGGSGLNITFRQTGNSAHTVSKLVSFPRSEVKKRKTPGSFEAAALCLKGQLCTVRGPFSGDSSKTFAAFEDRPAMVVAETPDAAYIRIPERTEPGARPLFIAENSKVVALPVAVGEFTLKNGDRQVQPGQTIVTFPILEGPSDISDAAWQAGNFPATNLEEARKLIPGFQLPREDRKGREQQEAEPKQESKEKREADEKKGGSILLVVKNLTPEQVSMRGAKDQMIVFHLSDESFSRGEFKYDLIVEAIKSGHFDIRGYVIPFLAPVRGQEFSASSSAGK